MSLALPPAVEVLAQRVVTEVGEACIKVGGKERKEKEITPPFAHPRGLGYSGCMQACMRERVS
jgi:hypothetical protein